MEFLYEKALPALPYVHLMPVGLVQPASVNLPEAVQDIGIVAMPLPYPVPQGMIAHPVRIVL